MREITVATVQFKPELGNSANNLIKMSDYISTITAEQKVDLIVFPELITTGYELGVRFTELAQRIPGPAINLMSQRAADVGCYVAFGLASKQKVESILYNSAVIIGPEGEVIGQYHKVHLKGEERMAFREGFKLPVFDCDDLGRVGLLIGWDLAFPEAARAMVLEGAEMICALANWDSLNMDEWKTYLRSRAYENAVYVIGANRVGEDITMSFGGQSMIIGPRGQIIAQIEQMDLPSEVKQEAIAAVIRADENRSEPTAIAVPEPADEKKDEKKDEKRTESDAKAEVSRKEEADRKRDADEKANEKAAAAKKEADEKRAEAALAEARKIPEATRAEAELKESLAALAEEPGKVSPLDMPRGNSSDYRELTDTEGYCVARIDLDEVRRYREEFQTLQSRQPIAYRVLAKKY